MKKIVVSSMAVALLLSVLTVSAQVSVVSATNTRNKVAVMPITYIAEGNDIKIEEMRFFLQDIAISYMSNAAAELKFMDAMTVNAILLKNGIIDENIRRYTPKELAAILQVEYIIMGSVLQDMGSVVTVDHNYNNRRQTVEHYGREVKVSHRSNRHSSSVTRQNIETQVSLSIYNEFGERIYTKSRHSLLSEQDSYKNTIHYLLKRTPLYKR